jgi:hypothetical protein
MCSAGYHYVPETVAVLHIIMFLPFKHVLLGTYVNTKAAVSKNFQQPHVLMIPEQAHHNMVRALGLSRNPRKKWID